LPAMSPNVAAPFLIAGARASPSRMQGSVTALFARLDRQLGIKPTSVPYKGAALKSGGSI
jgi:hypothetical protein